MRFIRFLFALQLGACAAWAQDTPDPHADHHMPDVPNPDAPAEPEPAAKVSHAEPMPSGSGTSENPQSWSMPMLMRRFEGWETSLMGTAYIADTQQSSPRGGDKLFSTNWLMASMERRAAGGELEFETMLSLEPLTVTNRRYPLLFQTGETAYGVPLVDAQHPHNFVMELAARYTLWLSARTSLELYAAPVGDPALGPVAFPHRASAAELPQATISHHLQDSTHIADSVVTVGLRAGKWKVEGSGFHGGEPGENRWTIGTGAIDSWSTRVWYFPSRRWAAQFSVGHLTNPEALTPGDQTRTTSSISYSKPVYVGTWSSTAVWGRINGPNGQIGNSYLIESLYPASRRDSVTGRIELADKDDLLPGRLFRVGAYTAGYVRELALIGSVRVGLGANVTKYSVPQQLETSYGASPIGGLVFLRLRVGGR